MAEFSMRFERSFVRSRRTAGVEVSREGDGGWGRGKEVCFV
jgi:hypothetical protein